jgi:transcription elongation factor GreA|tara:strand:- start:34 stop:510 length:477 start_codon:yes stop_codon:yes gene_type:complete
MGKVSYYTKEGLQSLKDKLVDLEKVQRPAISKQIGEAIDKGDLSENAEYDAAKEAQGLLELNISKLKDVLSDARLVDVSLIDTSKALILSTVRIKNKKNGMELSYTLVAENEANLKLFKISVESPIGKGLLGKKIGEIAHIITPGGVIEFEILDITRS